MIDYVISAFDICFDVKFKQKANKQDEMEKKNGSKSLDKLILHQRLKHFQLKF